MFPATNPGAYQRDDPFVMKADSPEYWLKFAIWPRGEHIEYAAGFGAECVTGSTHRRHAFINGFEAAGGG
jgi:hypothetical protein